MDEAWQTIEFLLYTMLKWILTNHRQLCLLFELTFLLDVPAIGISNGVDAFPLHKKVILAKNEIKGRNILSQAMINDGNTVYVIRYDFDLNNSEIVIPDNSVIEIKGGSLNYGTLVLSSNIRIKGNGCVCKLAHKGLSHKNFIRAVGVENIEFDDICIEGGYDNSGNIDPWKKFGDAENPIFIKDSSTIRFKHVGIAKFANDNKGPKSSTWDKDDKKYGFAAIKLYNCKDIVFDSCYERYSAGEAWEWTLCRNVTVSDLSMIRTYGVSSINVQACDNFVLKRSEFINDNCQGNIVNFTASNSRFSDNKVEVKFTDKELSSNGLIDFGNEFVNRRKNYYSEFVVQHNIFENNILRNSGFYNASEWQGTKIVNIMDIAFTNNKIFRDVSLGVPLQVVHLGHYQGVEDITINDNYVEFVNYPKENTYKRYQLIVAWTGKSEWDTYKGHEFHVKHLVITGNVIVDYSFSMNYIKYSDTFMKGPYGVVVLRNASDVIISNNKFLNVFCPIYSTIKDKAHNNVKGNTFTSHIDSVVY